MAEENAGSVNLLDQCNNDQKFELPTEEIVAQNPSDKSWKGIAIAILVILLISGVIVMAIYITSPGPKNVTIGEKFTFKDWFYGRNLQKSLVCEWIGKDVLSYINDSMDRKLLNLSTLTEEDVILKTYLEEKKALPSSISLSQDARFLLMSYNLNANYRHSATAQYTVFDIKNPQIRTDLGPVDNAALQNAAWSSTGHHIAFAFNNSLYYNLDPLENKGITCITKDLPVGGYITYGVADWLYEEEILKVSKAFWWSPESTSIAFMSFNDEAVADYKIKVYGEDEELNGHFINVKYPKAGELPISKNPVVKAFVFSFKANKVFEIPAPKEIPEDHYICLVKWIDEQHLLVGWLNREQNQAWLSLAMNWGSGSQIDSWVIHEEKVANGWSNMLKQTTLEPLISSNKKKIYLMLNRMTTGTEYRNIAEFDLNFTPNKYPVRKWAAIADFDFVDLLHHTDDFIYFSATNHGDPKEQHLFRSSKASGTVECLSCEDKNCAFSQHSFSQDGRFCIHSCLGPNVPYHQLLRHFSNGTFQFERMLITNTELREMLKIYAMPLIEFHKIKISVNKTADVELETKLMLPRRLNKKHVTQYPLLLSVYAGPSSQLVTKKFSIDWHSYLVSSLNIVVLFVDGRGTANRGRAFERAIYKQLGKVEIHDQLLAVQKIAEFSYINKTQVASYGWSYGGFTVGHLMGHPDNDLIRCGISVAPVTSFNYYDSAYTERYLGLRKNDKTGIYQQTDISLKAKYFAQKNFLLVHGTKDDNVHFLNSAKLIRALVANDISFDAMVYPDEAHTLMGGRTHIHVFRKMTTFLMNCYNRTSIENSVNLFAH